MKNTLIYIHGFNSGPGNKLEMFKSQLPKYDIIVPQLPFNPKDAIVLLESILEGLPKQNNNINIVSTSLGGFYAFYLLNKYPNFKYYFINPSINPVLSFTKRLNQTFENFVNGELKTVTEDYIEQLKEIELKWKPNFHKELLNSTNFFIGELDEVIDHTLLIKELNQLNHPYSLQICLEPHRFKDLSMVTRQIINNSLFD